ncbi:DesA/ISL3 alpha bundle tail domain-containing protein [Streptomyces clavifer]
MPRSSARDDCSGSPPAGRGTPRRSLPAGTTSSPGNGGKPGSAPSPTWGSSAPDDGGPDADPTVITGYKTARTDPAPPKPLTVRQVTGWLTRHPTALSAEDRASLNDVLARCPELDTAAGHVRDFGEILTGRLGSTLPAWIDAVEASQLPGLTGFALHVRRDLDAVAAGPTLNWSSCSIGAP